MCQVLCQGIHRLITFDPHLNPEVHIAGPIL